MPLTLEKQPLAQVVKSETAVYHQQVEDLLLPKLHSIASLQDYAAILSMFYGYYAPLEEAIQKYITPIVLPDIARRRTSGLILLDLEVLRIPFESSGLCRLLPQINNVPTAFGALYVLEGSTLGGKMIARMLAKNTSIVIPKNALHFFSGYREETGTMWVNFIKELNRQEEVGEIAFAANETFLHLKNWMQASLTK